MSDKKFMVGFGRVDITPTEPVPLAGYGNTSMRISQNILSRLYGTCIAFTDAEDNTVLLFHNDLIGNSVTYTSAIREAISQTVGVPFSHVLMASTHSHSTPDMMNRKEPSIPRYIEYLKGLLVKCAVEAMEDRKPAEMYITETFTKGLNFVRHYVLEDGSYKGDNFGDLNDSPYAGHTTEADPSMRLVKFVRDGGEDVLLVNWQSHPHRTGGSKKYDVSADIVGSMRDEVEAKSGCKFIYFTGGGGNINPHSRVAEENITADYLEQGKALAGYALAAMGSFTKAETGKVQVIENIHPAKVDRPSKQQYENALVVKELWERTNDRPACIRLANTFGMNSPYHANAVVAKYNAPEDTIDVLMYAFSIGDVGFVTAPYEMFDTNAKYVRDFSPFKMTVVASCANDMSISYVPSSYGFIHGCYEADCTRMMPGSGEVFARMYVNMLKELYETK